MPTIHLEAQVSPDELVKAADQLPLAELDRFVSQILALRARRAVASLPADEAELLVAINRGVPDDVRSRLDELGQRRDDEALTPPEHEELLRLIARVEELEAERVDHLARLARLRGVSITALMESLGIRGPDDDG